MSQWPGKPITQEQSWPGQRITEPEQRSTTQEVGRQLGLTGRAVAGGLAQAVEPFTEPVRYLMNKALPGNPIGNIEQATDQVLTRAGVPEPETGVERGVQGVGRFATSVGAGVGGSRGVEKALGITQPAAQVAPPTSAQLREYASSAYKAADDAGVVIAPDRFGTTVSQIASRVKDAGIDPTLHPKATAALQRLVNVGDEPLTLKEAETLRRVIKDVASSPDASERRIARIMTETLDDFMLNLKGSDVLAGDGQKAGAVLKDARNLWARMSKAETLEEAIEKAGVRAGQFSGSGYENALRTQFRQIAMNGKKMRMFKPEEQEAIKKVAMGGPMDNALRMLGKFAPRGVISGGIVPGMVASVGGWPAAAGLAAAGEAGRRGATAATAKNARTAVELMQRGAPAMKQGIPPFVPEWLVGGVIGADEGAY